MTRDADVLVIGAGPAGSSLALHLARRGFSVVIADKKAFPRHKPCGEFLSPECRPYFSELGLDDELHRLHVRKVYGMTLHADGATAPGRFFALPKAPYNEAGYAIRREVLDTAMIRAAAEKPEVTWLERHEFRSLLRAADGTVEGAVLRDPSGADRNLRARFTVAADGVHSRVARELSLQEPIRWLDRLALVGRFQGVAEKPGAEVHFVPGGYFAATTVDDGSFHLNLLTDRSALRGRDGDVDAFVQQHIEAAPALAQRLVGAQRLDPWRGIGPLAFRTRRQTVPGAALVGDACGYVDPLTGEGIFFALHGSRSLADAIEQAAAAPKATERAMRAYEARRRAEIGPRMALAALIQRGMRHPRLVRWVIGALAQKPRLCDLLVNLTGDALHPRDLLSPSFWRDWRRARQPA
jgi:flavin-dependent dehydrogenase